MISSNLNLIFLLPAPAGLQTASPETAGALGNDAHRLIPCRGEDKSFKDLEIPLSWRGESLPGYMRGKDFL
jgi:hypothetical protein